MRQKRQLQVGIASGCGLKVMHTAQLFSGWRVFEVEVLNGQPIDVVAVASSRASSIRTDLGVQLHCNSRVARLCSFNPD